MPDLIVPWTTPAGAERSRNWSWLRPNWETLGWPLYEAGGPGAAAARNAAIARGTSEVVFILDADLLLHRAQVRAACDLAVELGGYVVAHTTVHYLDDDETRTLIETGYVGAGREKPVVAHTWFGAFAVPRALWEEVGGFDERFGAWGRFAIGFWAACKTLAPLGRIPGSAHHLWHPERAFVEDERAAALIRRYRDAEGNPDAMRALIAESR